MTERSGIKYKRIIHRKTGQIHGTIAYRINFSDNVYELGVASLNPKDVYDSDIGKAIARERLESKHADFSAVICPSYIAPDAEFSISANQLSSAAKDELRTALNRIYRVGKFNTQAVCHAAFHAFGVPRSEYR